MIIGTAKVGLILSMETSKLSCMKHPITVTEYICGPCDRYASNISRFPLFLQPKISRY